MQWSDLCQQASPISRFPPAMLLQLRCIKMTSHSRGDISNVGPILREEILEERVVVGVYYSPVSRIL